MHVAFNRERIETIKRTKRVRYIYLCIVGANAWWWWRHNTIDNTCTRVVVNRISGKYTNFPPKKSASCP